LAAIFECDGSLFFMKRIIKIDKRYKLTLLTGVCCLMILTIGQIIPVHIIPDNYRGIYLLSIFGILVISVVKTIFDSLYLSGDYGKISSMMISLLVGIITFVVFGLWTLSLLLNN
jgi:FtsH-binding integral membrane protein